MSIPRNPMQGGSALDTTGRGAAANAPIRATRFTLKPSKQTAAILGGAMGLVVISCIGLYAWQTAELSDIQKQVDEKNNELASGQKIASKLESVRADYETTASQLRYLESSVTESEYVPTLLHQIEALAKSVNMQVDSIRPQFVYASKAAPPKKDAGSGGSDDKAKAPPAPTYDQLNVDMQMHGNYWATAKLLHRLTEFPKIMAVHSVEMHPTNQPLGGGSPQLQVHLTITGFVFPVTNGAAPSGVDSSDTSAGTTSMPPTAGPVGPAGPAGATPAAPGSTPAPSLPPAGRGPLPAAPARSQAPQQRAMTNHAAPATLSHGA